MPECTCDYKRIEGEENHECQLKLPVVEVLEHKINKERPVDEHNPLRYIFLSSGIFLSPI